MATTAELDRVSMIVLRFMRPPIFLLILVYGIGITGMALIPGIGADGQPTQMSLFHAFYFFTYTATTTGFGEIPSAFSDEQRLWAIFCLYMGVVAWLYAIGSIIRMVRNQHFIQAIHEYHFTRLVQRISQPFFIICGFGDTGSLLARGLSDHGFAGVVIDQDPERIKALGLRDYRIKMPGLCGDPSAPRHLVDAGVRHSQCQAVIALTCDEEINAKIAVVTRFLNPDVPILCRATSAKLYEHLSSIDNLTIINPFEIFAQLVIMAISAPNLHNLNSWLVGAPNVSLGRPLTVPSGNWIVCGYGRMGKWFNQEMERNGIHPLIIDPDIDEHAGVKRYIRGYADRSTLEGAGLASADGLIAGTDHDEANLHILMCARAMKPDLFTITRQNLHENELAFDAAKANLILQPSLTTGRRILKYLISPQIQALIEYLYQQGESKTLEVCKRLHDTLGDATPHLWCSHINRTHAVAVANLLQSGRELRLGDLTRHPSHRDRPLECVPLAIQRQGDTLMLPNARVAVHTDDRILFCGSRQCEQLLLGNLNNGYTLHYLLTGEEPPRGYFFQWLAKWRKSGSEEHEPA